MPNSQDYLNNIKGVISAYKQAGSAPADLPQVQHVIQSNYDRLNGAGYFTGDNARLGHVLRQEWSIQDPSQGGAIDPNGTPGNVDPYGDPTKPSAPSVPPHAPALPVPHSGNVLLNVLSRTGNAIASAGDAVGAGLSYMAQGSDDPIEKHFAQVHQNYLHALNQRNGGDALKQAHDNTLHAAQQVVHNANQHLFPHGTQPGTFLDTVHTTLSNVPKSAVDGVPQMVQGLSDGADRLNKAGGDLYESANGIRPVMTGGTQGSARNDARAFTAEAKAQTPGFVKDIYHGVPVSQTLKNEGNAFVANPVPGLIMAGGALAGLKGLASHGFETATALTEQADADAQAGNFAGANLKRNLAGALNEASTRVGKGAYHTTGQAASDFAGVIGRRAGAGAFASLPQDLQARVSALQSQHNLKTGQGQTAGTVPNLIADGNYGAMPANGGVFRVHSVVDASPDLPGFSPTTENRYNAPQPHPLVSLLTRKTPVGKPVAPETPVQPRPMPQEGAAPPPAPNTHSPNTQPQSSFRPNPKVRQMDTANKATLQGLGATLPELAPSHDWQVGRINGDGNGGYRVAVTLHEPHVSGPAKTVEWRPGEAFGGKVLSAMGIDRDSPALPKASAQSPSAETPVNATGKPAQAFGRQTGVPVPPAPETPLTGAQNGKPYVPPHTLPLSRNYQAGPYTATVQFPDALHRDLYDLGSKLYRRVDNVPEFKQNSTFAKTSALRKHIADQTGMDISDVNKVAYNVRNDVREQMKGVKDGETRAVTDNVTPHIPAMQAVRDGSLAGGGAATPQGTIASNTSPNNASPVGGAAPPPATGTPIDGAEGTQNATGQSAEQRQASDTVLQQRHGNGTAPTGNAGSNAPAPVAGAGEYPAKSGGDAAELRGQGGTGVGAGQYGIGANHYSQVRPATVGREGVDTIPPSSEYRPGRASSPGKVVVSPATSRAILAHLGETQESRLNANGYALTPEHVQDLQDVVPPETLAHLQHGMDDYGGHAVPVTVGKAGRGVAALRQTLLHEPQHVLQNKYPLSAGSRSTLTHSFAADPLTASAWERFTGEMDRRGYAPAQFLRELPAMIASGEYRSPLRDGQPLMPDAAAKVFFAEYVDTVRREHGRAAAAEIFNAAPSMARALRRSAGLSKDAQLTGFGDNGKPTFRLAPAPAERPYVPTGGGDYSHLQDPQAHFTDTQGTDAPTAMPADLYASHNPEWEDVTEPAPEHYTPHGAWDYSHLELPRDSGEAPKTPDLSAEHDPEHPAPAFYSHLQAVAEAKLPVRASAAQVRQTLTGAGVGEEELKYTGVDALLKEKEAAGQPVLREDVLETIHQHAPHYIYQPNWKGRGTAERIKALQVSEAGLPAVKKASDVAYARLATLTEATKGVPGLTPSVFDKIGQFITKYKGSFHPEILPEVLQANYNKLMQQAPMETASWIASAVQLAKETLEYQALNKQVEKPTLTRYGKFVEPNGRNYKEVVLTHTALPDGKIYTHRHWRETNPALHLRMNDRTGPNGERLLHLEEVQSDYHQEGREHGYKQKTLPDGFQFLLSNTHPGMIDAFSPEGEHIGSYSTANEARAAALQQLNAQAVPDAPFKKDWQANGIKFAVDHAVRNGYDGVSWTPGPEQAARYGIAKHLSELTYRKLSHENNDVYELSVKDVLGKPHSLTGHVPAEDLSDYVGKGVAEHILADKSPYGQPRTIDFTHAPHAVGGHGMTGFYGTAEQPGILHQTANRLYRRDGARVEKISIDTNPETGTGALWRVVPVDGGFAAEHKGINGWGVVRRFATEAEAENYTAPLQRNRLDVPYLPITEPLRRRILSEGQPLFGNSPKPQAKGANVKPHAAAPDLSAELPPAKRGPLRRVLSPEDLTHEDGSPKSGFIVPLDRMKVGEYHNPESGVRYAMRGGPEGPQMDANYGKVGFSSAGASIASGITNKIRVSDGIGHLMLQAPDAVMSNPDFFNIYAAEMEAKRRAGTLTAKDEAAAVADALGQLQTYVEQKSKPDYLLGQSITTMPELTQFAKEIPFDQRKKLILALGSATSVKKYGTVANADVLPRVVDFPGHNTGDIVGSVQFDKSRPEHTSAEAIGADPHPSYPLVHRGTHLGYFATPVPVAAALHDYFAQHGTLPQNKFSKAYFNKPVFTLKKSIIDRHATPLEAPYDTRSSPRLSNLFADDGRGNGRTAERADSSGSRHGSGAGAVAGGLAGGAGNALRTGRVGESAGQRAGSPTRSVDLQTPSPSNTPPSGAAPPPATQSTLELVNQYRRAAMLASPTMMARVIVSHGLHMAAEEVSRVPAATMDAVVSGITKQPRVVGGMDVRAMSRAAQMAASSGLKEAGILLKSGEQGLKASGVQSPLTGSLTAANDHAEFHSGNPALDKGVNSSFRMHGAVYHPMKVYLFHRSLEAQADLVGKNRVRVGSLPAGQRKAFAAALTQNPTPAMVLNAVQAAEVGTFVNQNALSGAISGAKQYLARQHTPGAGVLKFGMDTVAPFTTVPSNVVARMAEYGFGPALGMLTQIATGHHPSPEGALVGVLGTAAAKVAAEYLHSRSFTAADRQNLHTMIGRGMTGTALVWLGYKMRQNQLLTSPDEKRHALGSVHLWGHSINVGGFAPTLKLLTLGGIIADEEDNHFNAGQPLSFAPVVQDLTSDLPFFGQQSPLADMASGQDAGQQVGSYVGSYLPAFVAEAAGQMDTVKRVTQAPGTGARAEAQTAANVVKNRLPFVRQTLPVKRDMLGDPVPETNTLFDPFGTRRLTPMDTPAMEQLTRFHGEQAQGFGPQTEEGKANSDRKLAILKKARSGQDVSADVQGLVSDGVLTARQARTFNAHIHQDARVSMFRQLPADKATAVYALANAEEKRLLGPALQEKLQRDAALHPAHAASDRSVLLSLLARRGH